MFRGRLLRFVPVVALLVGTPAAGEVRFDVAPETDAFPQGAQCESSNCGGSLGAACRDNNDCASGHCFDRVCCAQAYCRPGQGCNVTGNEGTCTDWRVEGEPCARHSDCESFRCVISGANDTSTAGTCTSPLSPIDHVGLIIGPSFKLPPGPWFIAAADLDGDEVDDVAVASPQARVRGVLVSDRSGFFHQFVAFMGDDEVERIVASDVDGNTLADVVGILRNPRGIIVDLAVGDGSFVAAEFTPLPDLPVAILATDIDGDGVTETIVTDVEGRVRILRRKLDVSSQLEQAEVIDVGGDLIGLAAADLDLDGCEEILLLDAASDQLVVLFKRGEGRIERSNIRLGGEPIALAVDSFNPNSAPSVAILYEGALGFAIGLFTNVVSREKSETFVEEYTIPVPCPGTYHGMEIDCAATDLASADLNADGIPDLVVSISTWLSGAPDVLVPGLVQAFAGIGNGTFLFSARVNVGLGPRQIVSGDFNGSIFGGIAVSEHGVDATTPGMPTSAVRLVVASGPGPPRPEPLQCRQHRQCESGACVDGLCCTSPSCPEGERCDIPGFEGVCHPPLDLGESCNFAEQCLSGACVGGFCCASAGCPAGQFCNTGQCGDPAPVSTSCTANEQCELGFCVDRHCCETPLCPAGLRCDIPGDEGRCQVRLPLGAPCPGHLQCDASTWCTDGVCCESDDCGPNRTCNHPDAPGRCAPVGGCNQNSQCESGNCDFSEPNPPFNGQCGAPKTPTPCAPGCSGPCESAAHCQPGFFCNEKEGRICCDQRECPQGMSCRLPHALGFCQPLPTPTPNPPATRGAEEGGPDHIGDDGCRLSPQTSSPTAFWLLLTVGIVFATIPRRRSRIP